MNLRKIISKLYSVIFFATPLILFPNTSEIFEFNKIVFLYILTIFITTAWVVQIITDKKILFKKTSLDTPLLIFLFSQLISVIFSIDRQTSLFGFYGRFNGGFFSILSYTLLYWAYVSNVSEKYVKKHIFYLLGSFTIVTFYGVLQHFGIDKDLWVEDVKTRVFSTLGQPNWLATIVVSLLPIIWFFYLNPTNTFFGKNKKIWAILSTLFFIALIFTKSRSGMLSFGVSSLVFWYLATKNNFYNMKSDLVLLYFLFLISTLIFGSPWTKGVFQKPNIDSKTSSTTALEAEGTDSSTIRKIVWKGAFDIWKNNFLVGSGVETFAFSYYQYRPEEHNTTSEWEYLYNKAHNEYLNYLATTGIIGFASYLYLVFAILRNFWQNFKESESVFQLSLMSGFLGILTANFFGFSTSTTSLAFFLFPAFSINETKNKANQIPLKLPKLQQKVLAGVAVFIGILLFSSTLKYWYADYLYANARLQKSNGDFAKSIELLEKSVELSPSNSLFFAELASAYTDLAISQNTNSFISLALKNIDVSINISPANPDLFKKKANILLKLSTIDNKYLYEVITVLTKALELSPTDPKILYNIGLAQVRTGQNSEAIKTFSNAVALKPNYKKGRFALGLILADEGYKKEAREQFEYILEYISPDDSLIKQQLEEI